MMIIIIIINIMITPIYQKVIIIISNSWEISLLLPVVCYINTWSVQLIVDYFGLSENEFSFYHHHHPFIYKSYSSFIVIRLNSDDDDDEAK